MSPTFYEVSCKKHGRFLNKMDENLGNRHVSVGRPMTRKQRYNGGCPMCKKEEQETVRRDA